MIEFTFPWPPSVNQYYRHVGRKTLISKKGRDYIKAVKIIVGSIESTISEPVSIKILAYPPDRRKRDLDNILKALLDSITKSNIWLDDSQVNMINIKRENVIKGGNVKIYISII